MVQQKIELSAEKVRAIVIRIQQDNSSWTKEQKTFWECEQKLQENQLVILTTFKTSSLSRFLEQESLWQKVYFNWT